MSGLLGQKILGLAYSVAGLLTLLFVIADLRRSQSTTMTSASSAIGDHNSGSLKGAGWGRVAGLRGLRIFALVMSSLVAMVLSPLVVVDVLPSWYLEVATVVIMVPLLAFLWFERRATVPGYQTSTD